MANYTASALTAAQVKFKQQFNDADLRRKQNPALMLAIRNQAPLVVGIEELKKKDTMPVKAYIKNKRAASATNAKTHNHAGTKADTQEVTLAFIQIVEPFSINLKQANGNVFAYAEMLQHEMTQSAQNIHDRAGTLALAYLQANRTQLANLSTGGSGTWNNATSALEVAGTDSSRFFQMAASFMRRRLYTGALDVIADQPAYRQSEYLRNQGAANQTNLGWQIGNMSVVESVEDIDANYNLGSILAMQQGTFAGLNWNDPINMKGQGDYDSFLGGYGAIPDPLGSGLTFDFHAYTSRVDGTGTGGGVQDQNLEAEMTLTISWILQPISVANETPVYEIAQSA